MAELFPEGYADEVISEDEIAGEDSAGFMPSIFFSSEDGDFPRDGKNQTVVATGIEAWQQWCEKCIKTGRYKYLAYDTDYGIDTDEAFSAETKEEAESILTREITEAVLADPYQRAAYVESIEYDWTVAPDAVRVDVQIVGIDDVTIDVTAEIFRQ